MKKNLIIVYTAFLLACAFFAQGQKVVADKIIAQVGDRIILKSDIDNAIADYKRQDMESQLPPNPECSFLQGQYEIPLPLLLAFLHPQPGRYRKRIQLKKKALIKISLFQFSHQHPHGMQCSCKRI